MPQIDYYQVLNITESATGEEIKHAFFLLAKAYHPDLNHAADAKSKFEQINEAYSVLGHPEERALYDASRHEKKVTLDTFKKTSVDPSQKAKISKYRRALIWRAVFQVLSVAALTMLGFYLFALLATLCRLPARHWPVDLINATYAFYPIWSAIIGFTTGGLIMLDRLFKIESFITNPRMCQYFHHGRTLVISLGGALLFALLATLLNFSLHSQNNLLSIILTLLGFTLGTTIGSDGEFWPRIKKGEILSLLVIFFRTIGYGLLGSFCGIVIAVIFYLTFNQFAVFETAAVIGYAFAAILASTSEDEILHLTSELDKATKTLIFVITLLLVLAAGGIIGFLLGKNI